MRKYMKDKIKDLTEDDVAIIYDNSNLYKKIRTKKILIDVNGKIEIENFFQQKETSIEQSKQLLFRVFLINNSIKKMLDKRGLARRVGKDIDKIHNEMINPTKKVIAQLDDISQINKLIAHSNIEIFQLFLNQVSYIKGKRFTTIYPEALELLWNLSFSLFSTYLQQNFYLPTSYEYLFNSYRFYFCIDFINRYGFDNDDFSDDYILKDATIFLIFKLFEDKMIKLHKQKNGNIDEIVSHELVQIDNLIQFLEE